MHLIVVVDDNFGMLFNKRRQSQDRVLRQKISELTKDSKLYINPYTLKQFKEEYQNLVVVENPLEMTEDGSYCFIENMDVKPYEEKCEKIIVYYWNRVYPKDLKFNIDLSNWKCIEEIEFVGNSHDKITQKIYIRGEIDE